jgi:hypothetical protein
LKVVCLEDLENSYEAKPNIQNEGGNQDDEGTFKEMEESKSAYMLFLRASTKGLFPHGHIT